MDEAGCQHRAGGTDRMPVGNRAATENIKREEGKWAALVTKHGLKIE
jgi:hypothetical protein